jgi:hypothetical protein
VRLHREHHPVVVDVVTQFSSELVDDVAAYLLRQRARRVGHPETAPSDLDAYLALWYFARLVDRSALPDRLVVVPA